MICNSCSCAAPKSAALWRGVSSCGHCDPYDRVYSFSIPVPNSGTLSPATGNVSITLKLYADMRSSSGYVHMTIGTQGTRLTPALAGVLSGPSNGDCFKTGGSNICTCCAGSNLATFTVTDVFFNNHLDSSNRLPVSVFIAAGATIVPCVAESCSSCGAGNIDVGIQAVTVTWTPRPCNPPDCNDGNPCTDDSCVSGVCQHTNNGNSCNDGIFCNGTDTCAGGSCSAHSGDPCASGQLCCESSDTCVDECCNHAACADANACTTDSCVSGVCQNTNNNNSCNDSIFCNGTDTCSGGSCSAHTGTPCGPAQVCCEAIDLCNDNCCSDGDCAVNEICDAGQDVCLRTCSTDEDCDDGYPCTGTDTCVAGICQITFISDCQPNGREDFCDIDEETSTDCNVNGIPDECAGEEGLVALTGASFGCDDTLPRIRNNVLRLTFACNITEPDTGEVQIRELVADGAFGTDISDKFTFSVEGGNVLRILEDEQRSMEVLSDQTWYGISNMATWPGVDSFVMDYVVVYGDVNNTGFNDFGDLSDIQGNLGSAADDSRYDVNASGIVDFGDISDAFAFNGSFAPAKPTGHTCTVP